MNKRAFLLVGLASLIFSGEVWSQEFSIPVDTTISVPQPDSTYQLHQWIQEGTVTVRINDSELEPESWYLNYREGRWQLRNPDQWEEIPQLHFSYEYLPIDLAPRYFHRELVRPGRADTADGEEDDVMVARQQRQDIFGDTQLNRSGSLSRGITVGTAQDFSMQSGLRFELSGNITEDVYVEANLTDQNTPIQPEGTTQNIREFDQVLIQLETNNHALHMGDVDVSYDESDFAVIDRRLQGIDMMTDFGLYGGYDASAAVVRGQFRSQQFDGEDGIQGPYRLTGNQGEQFIIVLAGSERVYIDGERVLRGEENDYVIDYGLGEINFTSNQIITDNSRITVEFQYRTEEYTRTLVGAEGENATLMNGRLEVGASYIREADNINLSTQLQFSDEELDLLSDAGTDQPIVDGADSVGYSEDTDYVLYTRTDTLVNGETYEIYENRPGDPSGQYRVQFSRVEQGEGSYRRAGRSVNGVVYEWAGPGLGSYEPHRRLNAPEQQNMIAVRGSYQATNNLYVFGEWAGSELDQNRLSPLGETRQLDNAYVAGMGMDQVEIPVGTISANIRQRYIGRDFEFFDRGRVVEFERRWNIGRQRQNVQERITEGTMDWQATDHSSVDLNIGVIDREDVTGNRQEVTINSDEEGLPFLSFKGERVDSEDRPLDEVGIWYRQKGEIGYNFDFDIGTLTPVVGTEAEDRRQRSITEDTLTHNSLRFYDVRPELRWEMADLALSAGLSYRQDQRVLTGGFEDQSVGITQRYSVDWRPTERFRTENTLSFRSKTFEELFRIEEQRQNRQSVLLHSATNYRSENDLFDTNLQYEANTERRPIMEETYIEVGPEMGEYVWEDTRGDGVKHVDEFFPQQSPNEGTFIRQFVPSDELFPVVNLRLRFRNTLDPSDVLRDAGSDFFQMLEGSRLNTTVDVREENRTENISDIYLMQVNTFQDDSLTIQGRFSWQQDLEMLRNVSDWGLRFRVDQSRGLSRRANGVETSFSQNYRNEMRYRLRRRLTLENEILMMTNRNTSEELPSRNYDIEGFEVRPGLEIQLSRNYQTSFTVAHIQKEDRASENTSVIGWRVENDSRIYLGRRLQGNVRVAWRRNSITGTPSSLGNFELTDGAGAGDTWRWSLQANYRISDLLRARLSYDGRTVAERPLVQSIRLNVSAVF